jgi:hypothetical protein
MNYPDNIGTDTSDPRSPLYYAPECDECGGELSLDSDCDEDGVFVTTYCKECDNDN